MQQQPQPPPSSSARTLHLCGASQSSGSSLVSWCFLQRADMDGVLDARNDILPDMPKISTPMAWCKMTISSFRLSEMASFFKDEGWDVRPMLVMRDLRAVFNSLMSKSYGRNGITAEEPPLRMRLRRVHQDWQSAVKNGWPILRYESFVMEPEVSLKKVCEEMRIPWDAGMMTWPKQREQIAAPVHGSPTFRTSRGETLANTLKPSLCELKVERIPQDDLKWLEDEFADLNRAMNYPEHVPPPAGATAGRLVPSFENTRRHKRSRKPLARLGAIISKLSGTATDKSASSS